MSESCAVDPRPTVKEKVPEGIDLGDPGKLPADHSPENAAGQAHRPGGTPVLGKRRIEP
jgi:hypothetical protein